MSNGEERVSMDNTKAEIIDYLDKAGIETGEEGEDFEDLTKAELLELLDEEDVQEPEAEPAPPAAIVPEQIVTRRGTSVGGTRQMKKSEYDVEIAAERGETPVVEDEDGEDED